MPVLRTRFALSVGLSCALVASTECGGSPSQDGDASTDSSAPMDGTVDAPSATDANPSSDGGSGITQWYPGNYVLIATEGPSMNEQKALGTVLTSSFIADFQGVQLMYSWPNFEGAENDYTMGFAGLDADLEAIAAANKKLIIQAQYKEFDVMMPSVPAYMLANGPWCVGTVCGQYQTPNAVMPMVWQGNGTGGTSDRLKAWLEAMASHVAASAHAATVAGFVLPETAVGQGMVTYATAGYTSASYVAGLEGNATALAAGAPGIPVVQYINQLDVYPAMSGMTDGTYLAEYAAWAKAHPPIGIGCPDVVPASWGTYTVPAGYAVLLDAGYQGVLPYNVSVQMTDYQTPRTTGIDATYALATQPGPQGMASPFVNWQDPSPMTAVFSFASVGPYVQAHPDPATALPSY